MQQRLYDIWHRNRFLNLLSKPVAVGMSVWYRNRSRHLLINVAVGGFAAAFVFYVASSIYAANFFDFDFLLEPYGSPDRSSIFPALNVEAGDPRWRGILKGAGNTLSVVVFAIAVSSLLGLLVGVARLTHNPLISRMGKLYVELFRNLPLLLIMYFFAFAAFRELPQIEDRAGLSGVFFISNRGLAVPWVEAGNELWPFWLIALAAGGCGRMARAKAAHTARERDWPEPAPQCVGSRGLPAHRSGELPCAAPARPHHAP